MTALLNKVVAFSFLLQILLDNISKSVGNSTDLLRSKNSSPLGKSDKDPTPQTRITNGTNARQGYASYQLYYTRHGKYECGATLVEVYGIQVAITATHCVWVGSPHLDSIYSHNGVVVVAGDHNRSDTDGHEQYRSAVKIISHGFYDPRYFFNDISIIFLESDFDLNTYVDTAVIPGYNWDEPEGSLTVTGFGSLEYGGPLSEIMQTFAAPTIDFWVCVQYNQLGFKVTENQMCLGTLGLDYHQGACLGDSGGPALGYNETEKFWYLAGIVSFNMVRTCGSPIYPSVYTKVSKYTDWIRIEVSKFIQDKQKRR